MQNEIATVSPPSKDGSFFVDKRVPNRIITIEVVISAINDEELRKKIEEINAILDVEVEKPIQFHDEMDRIYYGIPQMTMDNGQIVATSEASISFLCTDPYKYSQEKIGLFPSDNVEVINNGNTDVFPIFEMDVLAPITFAMIRNQSGEYNTIGKPDDVFTIPYFREERIFRDDMANLNNWTYADSVEDGIAGGDLRGNGYSQTANSYGASPTSGNIHWHGPTIKTSIPNAPIQDFRVEVHVQFENGIEEVGKFQMDLLNANNEVVASLRLIDASESNQSVTGHIRAGNSQFNADIINDYGDLENTWSQFNGLLRLERNGTEWEALMSEERNGRLLARRFRTYTDVNENFMEPIYQIQLFWGQHLEKKPTRIYVHDVKLYQLHDTQENQPRYIAQEGDEIIFDHQTKEIFINGENRTDLKDFGASYFSLQKGVNQINVIPNDSLRTRIRYRERYK